MTQNNHFNRLLAQICLAVLALAAAIPAARAATFTWNGSSGNTTWGNGTNWVGGSAPATNGTATLSFGGNTTLSTNNTLTANTTFAGILLTNTTGNVTAGGGNFTLAGNAITLGGAITTTANSTAGAMLDTISLNMILGGNQTITTNSNHALTISGLISDGGNGYGITKNGTDTLTLTNANNSFSGNITINAGVLAYNNSSAITVANAISGAGQLQITGTAPVTLSNSPNSFTGQLAVFTGSTLNVASGGALGGGTSVILLGTGAGTDGTLNYTGSSDTTTARTLKIGNAATSTGNARINITSTGNLTFTSANFSSTQTSYTTNRTLTLGGNGTGVGIIQGVIFDQTAGTSLTSIIKADSGKWVLSGNNTFTNGVTVNGGTLQIGNGTAGNMVSNTLSFNGTGTMNFNEAAGSSQAMGLLTVNAGEGTVQSTYGSGSGNSALTFSNVTARAANTATAINFATSGGNATNNKIVLTQYNGAGLTAGALISTGVFFGGNNYATYDSTGYVRGLTTGDTGYVGGVSGSNAITSNASTNVALSGAVTAQATATVNTLNMGANNVTLVNGATFGTSGILASGSTNIIFDKTTAGNLQASTSGGELVVRVDGSTDQLTINPVIQDNTSASSLTKAGAGTLVLNGNNTYTGVTSIASGTLQLAGSAALGGGNYSANIANNGALQYSSSANQTLGGVISGLGGLTKDTSATSVLTITGNNTYTGLTTVNAGTLNLSGNNSAATGGVTLNAGQVNINSATAIGNGTLTIAGGTIDNTSAAAITLSTNNAQSWNGNFVFTGTKDLNLGTGAVAMNATRTVTVNGGNLTVGGIISGSTFGLTKNGTGTLVLSGNNTYTGATIINSGTLQIGNNGTSGTLSTSSAITNNGTLVFNRSNTITQGTDFASVISGTGNLTVASGNSTSGIVNLGSSNNTFSGAIAVNTGTLQISALSALGTGTSAITLGTTGNNAKLDFTSTTGTLTRGLTLTGTAQSFIANNSSTNITLSGNMIATNGGTWYFQNTGNVTVTGNFTQTGSAATINSAGSSGNLIIQGQITGNYSFGQVWANSSTLSNDANNYTGTTSVTGGSGSGTLNFTSIANQGVASSLGAYAAGNGQIAMASGTNNTTFNYIGSGNSTTDRQIRIGQNATATGIATISNNGTGTLVWTNSTFIGTQSSWTTNRTLVLSGNNTGANEIQGLIQDQTASTSTIAITKNGTGQWILSGNNTYTGATTVNAGTLVLNNSNSTLSGGITINGGTLQVGTGANSTASLRNGNYTSDISNNGTLSFQTTANQILSGNISGTGSIIVNPGQGGSLTLGGNNSYSGGTTFQGVAAKITNASALGNGTITFQGGGSFDSTVTAMNTNNAQNWNWDWTYLGATNSLNMGTGNVTLVAGSTANMTFVTVNNNTLTVGGVISGAAGRGLGKDGSGTLVLNGNNTFSGATRVNGGRLTANATNSLGGTSGITINTGGTLLLNAGNATKTTATLALAGGKLAMQSGGTGVSDTLGALTLSDSSIIDFGGQPSSGNNVLTLGAVSSWTGTLSIWNWSGTVGAAGGSDQLLVMGADQTSWQSQLGNISFYSGNGTGFLGIGGFVGNEIVAVPEPGTIAAGLAVLGLIAWRERKRLALIVRRSKKSAVIS